MKNISILFSYINHTWKYKYEMQINKCLWDLFFCVSCQHHQQHESSQANQQLQPIQRDHREQKQQRRGPSAMTRPEQQRPTPSSSPKLRIRLGSGPVSSILGVAAAGLCIVILRQPWHWWCWVKPGGMRIHGEEADGVTQVVWNSCGWNMLLPESVSWVLT